LVSLLLTTFWNARIDTETQKSLQNTAWWLATGWSDQQVYEWLEDPNFEKSRKEREARNDELIRTGYVGIFNLTDIVTSYEILINANSQDDFQRAQALNRWAWTLTINGLNLVPTDWRQATGYEVASEKYCAKEDVPTAALASARQALCLVERLTRDDGVRQNYTELTTSIEDTLERRTFI
jgi:hypothetical protein